MHKYFKTIAGVGNGSYIYYWRSKGLSDERINSVKTPNHSITPNLNYYGTTTRIKFNGSCELENCLFGAVTSTKNADIGKYKYPGYGIGFDRHGSFSSLGAGLARSVIIFGVDMSSSSKIDNKKRYFNFG